jgi:chemotaxis protein MotB
MAEDNTQPIIVKKIKKGGGGHHGGAWKIAYADFVTAMMAFFLLMWLLGSTTKEQKSAISDFFNNPSPIAGPGGASTSMIKIGGGKDITYSEGDTKNGSNPDPHPKNTQPSPKAEVGQITQTDKERLQQLKHELEGAIDASEALKPFKDQLLLEITKEGLRIQIIDKENRAMFASGSSTLQPYATQLLREIGKVVNHVPNRISLSGHTDATPYSKFSGMYTNWELSSDRSNASRRALIDGGMAEEKVARVVGLSSAVLFDKANPTNPINRRISIIVLNKETEDAILHDEGKLDQTTAESNAVETPPPAQTVPAPAAANNKPTPAAPAAPATPPVSIAPPPPVITPPAPVAPAQKPAAVNAVPPAAAAIAAAASAAAASAKKH